MPATDLSLDATPTTASGSGPDPVLAATELLTIRDFLRWGVSRFTEAGLVYGHGTTNAFDEAAFLILESLHLPIDQLEPYLDARLTAVERQTVAELLAARVITRKPASYLLGKAYIQGIPFHVDERVLIPRSYIGELLAVDTLFGPGGTLTPEPDAICSMLDLCTGSACLAILAALRFPDAHIDAVDLSADALAVAKRNLDLHHLQGRISLYQGDLFTPVDRCRYDLILANPPYVPTAGLAGLPPEFRHEPVQALDGGMDGLDMIRRIIDGAASHLNAAGALVCEIGAERPAVEAAYPGLPFLWLETEHSWGEVFHLSRADLLYL